MIRVWCIKDTVETRNYAENLKVESSEFKAVKEFIETILGELNQYWSETQEDQSVFRKKLDSIIPVLDTIANSCTEYSDAVIEYVTATEKISKETIGGN